MEILVVYETVEGQTRKIAEFVEERIRSAERAVRRFNTQDKCGEEISAERLNAAPFAYLCRDCAIPSKG